MSFQGFLIKWTHLQMKRINHPAKIIIQLLQQ